MSGQTLAEKIAGRHRISGPDRPPRAGDTVSLRPRQLLTHDNSAAILDRFRQTRAGLVRYPWQLLIALDHDVQNTDRDRLEVWREIASFAEAQRIDFRSCGSGVGHQIMVEDGFVVPGSLCVAADSHANMYGALGALGTPVVRSDAVGIWATGDFWWEVPPTVRVRLDGRLPDGSCGKDLALALCSNFNGGEVSNSIVEITGPGVAALTMEDRFTVANMTTEWGALAGIFPVDGLTVAWLEQARRDLIKRGVRRFTREQLEEWTVDPLTPDEDAEYAATIEVDLSTVGCGINGPHAPSGRATPGEVIPVDRAFLVGCANARLGDLETAAEVLRGKRVHRRVRFYVAAASRAVQDEAVRSGIWDDLIAAGARTLPPGCAMCIGLGEGLLEAGEVAISATNRNYPGRMGAVDSQAWLASPRVLAEAALAGEIRVPESRPLRARIDVATIEGPVVDGASVVEGFPERMAGEAVFVPVDALDTDRLFPSSAVYRDIDPDESRRLLLAHHDPEFADVAKGAQIFVGGFEFGCGSSREQAASAFAHAGFMLLVVGGMARTFRRNAANLGLLCVESPDFVRSVQTRFESPDIRSVRIPGRLEVDFARASIRHDGREFGLLVPPELIQQLYLGGGIVAGLRRRFGSRGGGV
jgi:homoaconitate hydratase